MSGSNRSAEIRLGTADLDAARAKLEQLGKSGDEALARLEAGGKRAATATAAVTGSADKTAYAMRALGAQSFQAFTSIASGAPIMQALIQQGGQVVDVAQNTGVGLGLVGTAARAMASALLTPTAALVGLGAGLALAVRHSAAMEAEARGLSVTLRAVGRDSEVSAGQLQTYIRTLQTAGVARSDAAGIVGGLSRNSALGGAQLGQVAGLTADTAAALGTDAASAAKRLGEAFSGSYAAIKSLDDELNVFTADQRLAIRTMLEHGDRAGALAVVYGTLKERVKGLDQDGLAPTERAIRGLSNAWTGLMDTIANSPAIKSAVLALTGLASVADYLLKSGGGDKGDPDIARLEAQLADRDSYGAPALSGEARSVVAGELANRRAMAMLKGGAATGGAAAAPAVGPVAPSGGPGAAPGDAEAQRQSKLLEEQNRKYEEQRRILAASVPDRARVKAEIAAENEIRERGLVGQAAETFRRQAVTMALREEGDARGQEMAAIERATSAEMNLARASEQGRAAMIQAKAAAEAHEKAATETGVSEEALTAALIDRAAAQEAAKGADTIVTLGEQLAATKALTAAERAGDRAAYYAAVDEKVRVATQSLAAYRDAAIDPAIKAALAVEIAEIERRTRAQEAGNVVLANEKALRIGRGQLDDIATEAGLIGKSADERERELAAMRALRGLVNSQGADPANLTQDQKEVVAQAKDIASANLQLTRQRDLYTEIGNSAGQAMDQVGSSITDALVKGEQSTIKFGNVLRGTIASVLQQVLKLGFVNPVLNSVLGTNLAGSSILSGGGAGGGGGFAGLSGLGNFSSVGSLFGGGGSSVSGFLSTPLWGADVAGPITAGGIAASGAPTLGGALGGIGLGFGAGTFANSLIGGNQLGGMIGSGLGSAAGFLVGGPIGSLIGGTLGGIAGGLFGPGKKHHGWSWTVGADDASGGLLSFKTQNVDEVAQQQFAQEQQQMAQINAFLQANNIKASGAYIVGGNNDPNLEKDYANLSGGFEMLRFSAKDAKLNAALSGRVVADPGELEALTAFVLQTLPQLDTAPLKQFDAAMKSLNDTYTAAIDQAKAYNLAEGDLVAERDRRVAELTAARDRDAAAITAGLTIRYDRATGKNQAADLLAADSSAIAERAALASQIADMGLAGTQYAADRIVQIEQTLAAERLAIEQKYATDMKATAQGLLTQLAFGSDSALAPEQRYFAAISYLNTARQGLDAGGSLADFSAVAQQVLPVARDFLGTSERYAALVAEIAGAVTARAGDPSGLGALLQAQVDGSDALRDVFAQYGDQQVSLMTATLAEMRRLSSTIEALLSRRAA